MRTGAMMIAVRMVVVVPCVRIHLPDQVAEIARAGRARAPRY